MARLVKSWEPHKPTCELQKSYGMKNHSVQGLNTIRTQYRIVTGFHSGLVISSQGYSYIDFWHMFSWQQSDSRLQYVSFQYVGKSTVTIHFDCFISFQWVQSPHCNFTKKLYFALTAQCERKRSIMAKKLISISILCNNEKN